MEDRRGCTFHLRLVVPGGPAGGTLRISVPYNGGLKPGRLGEAGERPNRGAAVGVDTSQMHRESISLEFSDLECLLNGILV